MIGRNDLISLPVYLLSPFFFLLSAASDGSLSTKQIVFLQRPVLGRKRRESKVRDLNIPPRVCGPMWRLRPAPSLTCSPSLQDQHHLLLPEVLLLFWFYAAKTHPHTQRQTTADGLCWSYQTFFRSRRALDVLFFGEAMFFRRPSAVWITSKP